MAYVEPEQEAIEGFLATFPADKEVVMLNLLKFHVQADYPAEKDVEACTGFEAFIRYGMAAMPLIEIAGGEQIWQGRPVSMLIGPHDQQWDLAVLVRYPSAEAFLGMMASPEYQAISFHRSAALEDSRLLAHEDL
jgi:uncharacterized protein (DUF1330 family)